MKVPVGLFDDPLFRLQESPRQAIVAYWPLSDTMIKETTRVTRICLNCVEKVEAKMAARGLR